MATREMLGTVSLSSSSRLEVNWTPRNAEPCEVATWSREACHKPAANWIATGRHDDRDGGAQFPGDTECWLTPRHQHVQRYSPRGSWPQCGTGPPQRQGDR